MGDGIALYFTTATNTAFFPALNGAMAAVFTLVVLRKPIGSWTAIATVLATCGGLLVISYSSSGGGSLVGDGIALAAAAAYTAYIFCVDWQVGAKSEFSTVDLIAIGSVEMVVVAGLSWLIILAMPGQSLTISWNEKIIHAAIYVGLFTTFAPTLIAALFQRFVAPMTVALLYILEPIWGALAANLIEGEVLALAAYFGGALIVVASVVNVLGSRQKGSPI